MILGSMAMSLMVGIFGMYIAYRGIKGGFKLLRLFFDAIENWVTDKIG